MEASPPTYQNLEFLDVSYNALSVTLLLDLSYLVKLRHLGLLRKLLLWQHPREYLKLKNLEHFSLRGNCLSEEIPGGIGNLENLKTLLLGENLFHGGISFPDRKFDQACTHGYVFLWP